MENFPSKELAECVGLWLAEGDRKTKSEITFTNNCIDLIDLFYKTLINLFKEKKDKIRLYVYSNGNEKINPTYKGITIKNYINKRARKPYYILRLASVELVKKWRKVVNETINNPELSIYLLRGFFAGEGNLKESSKSSRIIRIAQKGPNKLIEAILKPLRITFSFRINERNYYIFGKLNWDIFAKYNLADLHPNKKEKFWRFYNNFKQNHYKHNYLRDSIFLSLNDPQTPRKLMKEYNRSFARIQDILIDLKKQKKIRNFRIGSIDYWTNKKDLIIISKLKNNYLLYLTKSRKTSDFAKRFKVDPKSSFRRLKELQTLNLVERDKNKNWMIIPTNKEIRVINNNG